MGDHISGSNLCVIYFQELLGSVTIYLYEENYTPGHENIYISSSLSPHNGILVPRRLEISSPGPKKAYIITAVTRFGKKLLPQ